ncbi:di-heme oxidoredictase family protein [Halomonas sp. PA16-9]|uniref:di-heme oxidoredictase family protein n=1 Tax=Halomonas sp. PA16-9 TaxID=2576841 RepID=UPI003FA563FD
MAAADPDDADDDGISGRANRVWDLRTGSTVMGRFGWKAGEPSIEQQGLHAFAGDMGLTSSLVPQTDCMESQGCDDFPNGGTPEVSDDVADFVTFYASSLAVPMRRNMDDSAVKQGAERFNALGCASCHTPRHRTAADTARPALANQEIWPYSDLLLHDLAMPWLIIAASSRPMAENGAPRRCGASAWRKRLTPGLVFSTMVAPALWKRRYSGTVVRQKALPRAIAHCPLTSERNLYVSLNPCKSLLLRS